MRSFLSFPNAFPFSTYCQVHVFSTTVRSAILCIDNIFIDDITITLD